MRDLFRQQELRFRRRFYPEASGADWRDWRWQLRRRARNAAEISRILKLSERERRALLAPEVWRLPVAINPYVLFLLSQEPADGPLRRIFLPDLREGRRRRTELIDPLGEKAHTVAPALVRSYPHKGLLLVTGDCPSFCRYCTRARQAGFPPADLSAALDWLAEHPQIRDVLLSGGDPLTLEDSALEQILRKLRRIRHIELIRIGTRAPATLPQRITPALAKMLKKFRPLWLSVHFSHPAELTPWAAEACDRLVSAGIPLMNQTVLLRGINDDYDTLSRLNQHLLTLGVKPYYLHHGDAAAGTAHLRSTIARGRAILRAMCGNLTGYAIPLFMHDRPGGGGKIPIGPAGGSPLPARDKSPPPPVRGTPEPKAAKAKYHS